MAGNSARVSVARGEGKEERVDTKAMIRLFSVPNRRQNELPRARLGIPRVAISRSR